MRSAVCRGTVFRQTTAGQQRNNSENGGHILHDNGQSEDQSCADFQPQT